ncbi:hypothetical protein QCA50_020313 [Cerrena zonata]|uniref:Uncharacterized protein n=1 Tax=Cerrena zonata TaxID=2478898 RepID=A0AAW0FHR9_9APHY
MMDVYHETQRCTVSEVRVDCSGRKRSLAEVLSRRERNPSSKYFTSKGAHRPDFMRYQCLQPYKRYLVSCLTQDLLARPIGANVTDFHHNPLFAYNPKSDKIPFKHF